jgi:hypothetical protein
MRGETITMYGEIKGRTDLAVLFAPNDEPGMEAWLPLSQIEIRGSDEDCEIEIPEWLAEAKELD